MTLPLPLPLRTLTLALLLAAAPLAAQQRIVVLPEPGTPVVATQVLVATGPADEPPERAGVAYLAARAVTAPLLPTLDSLGAHLAVEAHKDAVAFTLTAAPDAWEAATRSLLVALFRDPPERAVVERERQAVSRELRARESNPTDATIRTLDHAHFGEDHPWARPTVGYPGTVDKLTVPDVDAFLRAHFTAERTVVAVVGPVDAASAREHLRTFVRADGPLPFTPLPPRPAESPVRRESNTITTWVAISYGFAEDADLEALRFLAQLATAELSFSPSRQSVYDASSQVIARPGGGELRFQLVTPPEEAEQWAARIEEVVQQIASGEMHEELFRARLRRYWGERLHGLSAPEDRAREMARRLLVSGRAGTLLPDPDALTAARLRAAGRALSRPTTVFLGPNLNQAD